MNKKQKAMLASYGRSFLAACTTAFMIQGGDLFALDGDSLRTILSAGIAAVLPVALRAANKNDPAFGKVADAVTESVVREITKKKAPSRKATPKK